MNSAYPELARKKSGELRRVKALKPEAYIVGEVWREAREWLQGDRFDAVMNYPFAAATIAFTAGRRVSHALVKGRSYDPYPGSDAPEFGRRLQRLLNLYDWEVTQAQLNLLDSHDTARLSYVTGSSQAQIREEISRRFGYNLGRSLDEIRPTYQFDETCQGSVPESISAFLESASFEDAIRKGNQEVGGSVIEMAEAEYMVRATGYVRSIEDLERKTVIIVQSYRRPNNVESRNLNSIFGGASGSPDLRLTRPRPSGCKWTGVIMKPGQAWGMMPSRSRRSME